MMYSHIEHWVFLLRKTSGVCDLIIRGNMVIVFQNKLFSQKKKCFPFSLLDRLILSLNVVEQACPRSRQGANRGLWTDFKELQFVVHVIG